MHAARSGDEGTSPIVGARAHLDFPHAHGLSLTCPRPVELSVEDQAPLEARRREFNQLSEWNQTADELPDHVDARFCELEADIERLEAKRHAYDPDDIARGGAFVILNHDGMVRIERGFIRPGDERPRLKAEQAGEVLAAGDAEGNDSQAHQRDAVAVDPALGGAIPGKGL